MNKRYFLIVIVVLGVMVLVLGSLAGWEYSRKLKVIEEMEQERAQILKYGFYRDSLMLELNYKMELNIQHILLNSDNSHYTDERFIIYIPKGICFSCIKGKILKLIQMLKLPDLQLSILCHQDNERNVFLFKAKKRIFKQFF